MKKRIIGILFAAMVVLLLGVSVAGCGYKPHGTFYSLQEAYDAGYITRADLEEIAERNNNGPAISRKELDEQIEQMICEDEAERLRTREEDPVPEAEADSVYISSYYGVFQGDCYAVMLWNYYFVYIPEIGSPNETIDGIEIVYSNPKRVEIWKKN